MLTTQTNKETHCKCSQHNQIHFISNAVLFWLCSERLQCVHCQIDASVFLICRGFFLFAARFFFWLCCEYLQRVCCQIDKSVFLICRCFFLFAARFFFWLCCEYLQRVCCQIDKSVFLICRCFFLFVARFFFWLCCEYLQRVCVVKSCVLNLHVFSEVAACWALSATVVSTVFSLQDDVVLAAVG